MATRRRGLVKALAAAARKGTSFGAPTELEVKLAELVRAHMPSIEMVRFVSSGTEATMSAVRVARAHTRREKIIKFEGCYHGHADEFLVQAGSGLTTLGVPTSPGVTRAAAADTLLATYNDLASVERLCESFPDQIAALIVEPIAGNMGVVLPEPRFLPGLRELCTRYRILLVFDEVISGFRIGTGGAQGWSGVVPDLTCLGKIIGGGSAGRRLWRPRGADAPGGAGGTGLSGRHAVGQSAGDDRRIVEPETAVQGSLQAAERAWRRARRRPRRCREGARVLRCRSTESDRR